MTDDEITEIAAALVDDLDTYDLPDGRSVQLRVLPDEYTSIMDEQGEGVWCGKLAHEDSRRKNENGYVMRPEGFTGAAEKFWAGNEGPFWWEVPEDLRTPDMAETKRSVRQEIIDRILCGYSVVSVELREVCNLGAPHVIEQSSCHGVNEPYPELIKELLVELFAINEEVPA